MGGLGLVVTVVGWWLLENWGGGRHASLWLWYASKILIECFDGRGRAVSLFIVVSVFSYGFVSKTLTFAAFTQVDVAALIT